MALNIWKRNAEIKKASILGVVWAIISRKNLVYATTYSSWLLLQLAADTVAARNLSDVELVLWWQSWRYGVYINHRCGQRAKRTCWWFSRCHQKKAFNCEAEEIKLNWKKLELQLLLSTLVALTWLEAAILRSSGFLWGGQKGANYKVYQRTSTGADFMFLVTWIEFHGCVCYRAYSLSNVLRGYCFLKCIRVCNRRYEGAMAC